MHTHTVMHTHTHIQSHTHRHTTIVTHAVQSHMPYRHTQIQSQSHKHIQSHTHTHTNTNTVTHTYKVYRLINRAHSFPRPAEFFGFLPRNFSREIRLFAAEFDVFHSNNYFFTENDLKV